MAQDVKGFLKSYFAQMHFNHMADNGGGQLRQFSEWVRKDELTAEMEEWVSKYVEIDPVTKKVRFDHGNVVLKPIPQINGATDNDLDDDGREQLFLKLQKVFISLNKNKDSLNTDTKQLLDRYFGTMFVMPPATPECETGIQQIITVLEKPTVGSNIQGYLERQLKNKNISKLISDCKSGKYNSSAETRDLIQNVADILLRAVSWDSGIKGSPEYDAIQNIVSGLQNVVATDAFSMDVANIPADRLNLFVNDGAGQDILNQIYRNANISKDLDEHGDSEGKDIVKHKNAALKKITYHDEKDDNYVPPVITDKLNAKQQIAKWARNTYKDSFKKYEQLRGGKLFFGQEAKDIFDAVDSAKVKPTDGLDGLLKNATDIKGKLKNPKAKQHFQWFVDTMGPIQKAMPKAVAGAWQNGVQQKAVIQQIILAAVKTDPGKAPDPVAIEKAKTAMQVMQTMKYGMLTSKVMDALGKEDFKVFSDGGLSWNKNEGVKFVTTAFDKSVKAAFMGVGYGVTFVNNWISMKKGRKFKNKDNRGNGQMHNAFETETQRLRDEHKAFVKAKPGRDTADSNERTYQQNILNNLDTRGINATTIDTLKARKETETRDLKNIYRNRLKPQEDIMSRNKTEYDEYIKQQNLQSTAVTELGIKQPELTRKLSDLNTIQNTDIPNKQNEITNKRNEIAAADPHNDALNTRLQTELQTLLAELRDLTDEETKLVTETNDLNQQIADLTAQENTANAFINDPDHTQHYNDYTTAFTTHDNIKRHHNYDARNTSLKDLTNDIDSFKTATKRVQELNKGIDKRNEEANHWDDQHHNAVLELENYWNFLQTGVTNTWRLSLKKAQADLNRRNK